MSADTEGFGDVHSRLRQFVEARGWTRFHSPKNLTMALTGELGELVELFQWLTSEQTDNLDAETLSRAVSEIADVQIYLMLLADRLDVDLTEAVKEKIEENDKKYPVDKAYGRSDKYTDL